MFLLLQGHGPHKFPNPTDTERAFGAGVVVSSAAPGAALRCCGGVITGSKGDGICLLCIIQGGEIPPRQEGGFKAALGFTDCWSACL